MAASERWYFKLEEIHSTPSIKCGYDHDKELFCRQQAANFIQDMGQRLQVNQLCINTAIVYMHRFYMFHSFTRFHRTSLASASLFLAAKVEEQPRKLEHVIRFAQICLHKEQIPFDVTSQAYMEQSQDLIMNENILLQTLGFDVAIDHPHTHIVRCCQLVRASKDLAQTSYFMASYSLHLTTMCLQYKPTVVACFCIHLACKWSNWEIPESSEGRPWFWYVDKSVTSELLEDLTAEFLNLFEKCPSRLKRKIMALSTYSNIPQSIANSQPMPAGQSQQQQELDKRKDRHTVDSHNPMNSVPHPIGPLAAAMSEANAAMNSMSGAGAGPHPFMHQNIIGRHGNSEELPKKRHYDHNQRLSGGPPTLPPPSMPEPTYKKPHHPPHHQRESHGMPLPSGSSKPSCMFDGGSVQHGQPPLHKPNYPHGPMPTSGHINPPPIHPATVVNSSSNRIPKIDHTSPGALHRPPSSRPLHARNGEATHFQEKKYPEIKKDIAEVKPIPMIPLHVQPVKARPKTPPQQLNLVPQVMPLLPSKVERSIFSPEEKAVSPPPVKIPEKIIKISPPQTPRTPVEIKRDSPEVETPVVQIQPQIPQQLVPPKTDEKPSAIPGSPPTSAPAQPDTPSKSAHKKKKKKHKEHKDRHKDKHKHKHKVKDPEPIVITIPKDKITISHPEGLKIKIAKEKISNPSSGLKLKISKDKLKETKKRDRSDGEEEELEHPSKQHRPNGTTTLQVSLETGGRH